MKNIHTMKKATFYKRAAQRYFKHKIGRSQAFLVILLVTNRCNLRCSYCPETQEQRKVDIPLKYMFKILDRLDAESVPAISLSGGEPLLHPGFDKIAKYASSKGFIVNLNTNGTMLADYIQSITQLDYIRISLDGDEKRHDSVCKVKGTFKRVIHNIHALSSVKKRGKIGLNIVVNDKNISSVRNLIERMQNHVDFISLLPEFNSYQAEVNFKKYRKINSDYGIVSQANTEHLLNSNADDVRKICEAGRLFYAISWDGNIYPCPFMIETKTMNASYDFKPPTLIERPAENCQGCRATCAVEISRVLNLSPVGLAKEILGLKRTFHV
jgi:MoaA/NifB/PqqE/SkfB family radical SAM enzyme